MMKTIRFSVAAVAAVSLLWGSGAAHGATRSVKKQTTTTKAATTTTAAPATTVAEKPVTIRFENYNLATAGPGREATLKLLANFEKKNPLIKVETKATGSEQMFQSIQAQLAAGNPPDIAQLVLREWDQNIDNFPLVVLEDSPQIGAAALKQHLESGYPYHPKAAALTQRNGKTYGLSYVFSTPTLFYNADIFKKAGLDPNKPPKTWKDVELAANRIQLVADKQGLYIACIELDWCTQGMLRSSGARAMSVDRQKIGWASEESISMFRWWQELVKTGAHVRLNGAQATDAFSAGNLGMMLQTSASQGGFLRASAGKWDLRATGMPTFEGKPVVPVNSGAGLGILAKDPAKIKASWELMKYLTSEEAQQIITTEIGYLPLRPGMVDDEKYLKNWKERDLIIPNLKQLDTLEPSLSYAGPNALQIRSLFLTSMQKILYDGANARDTLVDAAKRAQEMVK
jgi:multiple sugar transport system substrate-binding protein